MVGHKKNKRGSIPSSMSSISKTEMIERIPENDYGVLSDPEENYPSSPVYHLTEEMETETVTVTVTTNAAETAVATNVVALVVAAKEPTDTSQAQAQAPDGYADNYNPYELSQTSHVSQHSSPSLQAQHPSSQSQISQDQSSKSLNALKLKLTTDKNYSKKITLHTFFSYIILSIEIERASSSSIGRISVHNVEKLVEYMIEHHSARDDIKIYLQTLVEMDVIKHMISSVIDFNKDNHDTLDKLLSAEQMELEMIFSKDATNTTTGTAINTETIPVTISTSDATHSHPAPQTPHQSCGFFKCLRRFFSGCCGNSR